MIESRIQGESEGFGGETVFVLDNGHVYRQIEYYYHYRYAYRPRVSVDSLRIRIEGIDRAIRVERLA